SRQDPRSRARGCRGGPGAPQARLRAHMARTARGLRSLRLSPADARALQGRMVEPGRPADLHGSRLRCGLGGQRRSGRTPHAGEGGMRKTIDEILDDAAVSLGRLSPIEAWAEMRAGAVL